MVPHHALLTAYRTRFSLPLSRFPHVHIPSAYASSVVVAVVVIVVLLLIPSAIHRVNWGIVKSSPIPSPIACFVPKIWFSSAMVLAEDAPTCA